MKTFVVDAFYVVELIEAKNCDEARNKFRTMHGNGPEIIAIIEQ